jgi:peptidoglycan/xylan/chitin deacetylase (PgdA/CDA1 family)
MVRYWLLPFAVFLLTINVAFANSCWPNNDQLVISVDMVVEAGGQPAGAQSPVSTDPLPKGYPDTAADTWWAYGYKEGAQRLLNLWDKHDIKVTAFIIGEAALKHPEIAKEIVARGHEVSGHGMYWIPGEYKMSYDAEKKFIKDGIDAVKKATGAPSLGYNAYWMRRSKNTLKILQDLGFIYHSDDVSRDQPYVTLVRGKPFAVVPHVINTNDIVLIEGKNFSADQYQNQLKREFDQLYAVGTKQCRMMVISAHDRISGTPANTQALDEFIKYAKSHPGVAFMRKVDIAKHVLSEKNPLIDNTEAEYNK